MHGVQYVIYIESFYKILLLNFRFIQNKKLVDFKHVLGRNSYPNSCHQIITYQLALGQHPAGHEVSLGPHCFLAAIFMSLSFLATKGQSAAVAAQYKSSGQQYQLASGQHPAGHEVSLGPHCSDLRSFSLVALATARKAKATITLMV